MNDDTKLLIVWAALAVIWAALSYVVAAFVAWDLDPSTWGGAGRWVCAVFAWSGCVISGIAVQDVRKRREANR